MTFQANPEAILFLAAAVVSGLLAFFAWRRRSLAMAPAFAVMMTGETVWALSQALELLVVEMAAKQPFYELRNAGAVTAILGLLAVVLRYTGHVEWLKLPVFTAVCTPAVVMILFAWTNDWHHFYWYRHEAVLARVCVRPPGVRTGFLGALHVLLRPGRCFDDLACAGGGAVSGALSRTGDGDALRRAASVVREHGGHVSDSG